MVVLLSDLAEELNSSVSELQSMLNKYDLDWNPEISINMGLKSILKSKL